jgi:glutamyl-tRNA synthetase
MSQDLPNRSGSAGVVTRIAPSPTGSMHIGTARTALFNYLYARHCGGRFLVRIEDTDRERSTEANVQIILDGLEWLGLTPDAPPVFQFARADRHREAVDQLLAAGRAYRCWMTPEETAEARDKARAAGHALRSTWRDKTPKPGMEAKPFVVRFKGPLTGDTVIDDLVQGRVSFHNRDLDDLVLLRSDGTPTYNLSVVVDDHDMGITHVIRGDDHLNNAARQKLIYQALDWETPAFAHVPLIHGADGAKLSKRHGAQAVGDFAALGYLPEAMRNYLARLGWSHGDDEIFSDEQAIEWFDIADGLRAPGRLDFDKLNFVNAHYIRLADDHRLAGLVADVLQGRGQLLTADEQAALARAMPVLKDRGKTLLELADQAAFLFLRRPVPMDDRARNQLTAFALQQIETLLPILKTTAWTVSDLEAALKGFAESQGIGFGKFAPAVRAALTGGSASPDLAKTLFALGSAEALARLQDALSHGE